MTQWRTVLEKLIVSTLLKNPPHLIETKGSLTRSQQLATCPYLAPD
jgi:hypothetical protein